MNRELATTFASPAVDTALLGAMRRIDMCDAEADAGMEISRSGKTIAWSTADHAP